MKSVISIAGCVCALLLCSCENCIQQPRQISEADKKFATEMGAKLEKVPLDANLKVTYQNVMKDTYQNMSDKNVALFLCLSAIDCYARHKHLSEAVQKELIDTVRSYMMANAGVSGGTGPLSPLEKQIIKNGSNADEILQLFEKLGVKAES